MSGRILRLLTAPGRPLRRLSLPGFGLEPTTLRLTAPDKRARIVWNPQGFGAPNIPANSANAYYPGDAYVDVVANDL